MLTGGVPLLQRLYAWGEEFGGEELIGLSSVTGMYDVRFWGPFVEGFPVPAHPLSLGFRIYLACHIS